MQNGLPGQHQLESRGTIGNKNDLDQSRMGSKPRPKGVWERAQSAAKEATAHSQDESGPMTAIPRQAAAQEAAAHQTSAEASHAMGMHAQRSAASISMHAQQDPKPSPSSRKDAEQHPTSPQNRAYDAIILLHADHAN